MYYLRIICSLILFIALSSCGSLNVREYGASSNQDKLATTGNINTPTSSTNTFEGSLKVCEAIDAPDDPEAYLTGWERASNQFQLQVPSNRRVQAQKSWYVKHKKYLNRVSKRASPYLYFIIDEIEKRGLPLELALLPIVESAYDPFAYSHGRASGMWQFIPGTGKGYGLTQNWWYDGRRDIFLSTHAALDYLSYLHKHFKGDWLHALAAYNSGLGNVGKAIRKNIRKGKPTDFWSLKLPRETKAYVPKLLALAEILKEHIKAPSYIDNGNGAEVVWYPTKNEPYFTRVSTDAQIDLSLAADLSEQTMSEFYQLNPAFNHWATAPKGPHYLLFPIDKARLFQENLNSIPKNERIAFKRYKIRDGDTISQIAQQFSTSVSLLKRTNQMRSNNIRVGKSLLIPVPSKSRARYSKSNQQRLLAKQRVNRKGHKMSIKVRPGDSFWTLSRNYQVSMRQLAGWNNMAPTDTLRAGQKLVLWTKQANIKTAALMSHKNKTKKIHYKVRSGDSFARIADKFKVSLNKVKQWNSSLSKKKYLQPGQSLTLFVDITNQF